MRARRLAVGLALVGSIAALGACQRGAEQPVAKGPPARPAGSPVAVRIVPQVGHGEHTDGYLMDGACGLYSRGEGGTLRWDLATGTVAQRYPYRKLQVARGDSLVFLTGENGFDLVGVDPRTGAVRFTRPRVLEVHADPRVGRALLVDYTQVSPDVLRRDVRLFDVVTGVTTEPIDSLGGSDAPLYGCAAFSPDGRFVAASARHEAVVTLYDLASGTVQARIGEKDVAGDGRLAGWSAMCTMGVDAEGRVGRLTDKTLAIFERTAVRDVISDVAAFHLAAGVAVLTTGAVVSLDPKKSERFHFAQGEELVDLSADGLRVATRVAGRTQVRDAVTGRVVASTPGPAFEAEQTSFVCADALLFSRESGAAGAWTLGSGRVQALGAREPGQPTSATFTPDGREIAVVYDDHALGIWDLGDLAFKGARPLVGVGRVSAIASAPDGQRFALGTWEGNVVLVSRSGRVLHDHRRKKRVVAIHWLPGDKLLVGDAAGEMALMDAESGELVARKKTDGAPFIGGTFYGAYAVSPDGKTAVGGRERLTVWDLASEASRASDPMPYDADFMQIRNGLSPIVVGAAHLSVAVGGRAIAAVGEISGSNATPIVVDPASGKVRALPDPGADTPVDHESLSGGVAFSQDGSEIYTASGGEVVRVDASTGAVRGRVRAHAGLIDHVELTRDGGHVLTASSREGALRLEQRSTGRAVYLVASGSDWIAYDDEGLFDMSRRGSDLVSLVADGRSYRVDQLAPRFNRPDLLLERVGLGSPEALARMRGQRARRLRRLGLDEATLGARFDAAPRAVITSLTPDPQDPKVATLEATLTAAGADLVGYELFVNDVPVAPSVRTAKGRSHGVRERVELGAGRNKVEIVARDAAGAESFRDVRTVTYAGKPRSRDLFFLGFGVSKHKDRRVNDLLFAHKDAEDLARAFSSVRAFDHVHVKTLTNEAVTRRGVAEAGAWLRGATVDDTVVVFMAGHGVYTRGASPEYHYITHDVDLDRLEATAAPFSLVESLMVDMAPRQKLLLLDTCESGERDSGAASAPAGTGDLVSRGLVLTGATASHGGPRAARRDVPDQDRFSEADLLRRTGAVVLSSSRGDEPSYELSSLRNGVFTSALVRALTSREGDANGDGYLDMSELLTFVRSEVVRLTDDRQHPTIDRDNLDVGLRLATTTLCAEGTRWDGNACAPVPPLPAIVKPEDPTVRVPSGAFVASADPQSKRAPRRVELRAFEIDRTEVPAASYASCVAAGARVAHG
ncbi:MAG TPA: caspase family protein [Polyangiaceae bacterium]|nr:caspase family protein [Polyangiaceae bacterium]